MENYIKKICDFIIDNSIYYYHILKFKLIDFNKKTLGIKEKNEHNTPRIVVSITSIPSRFDKLYLCLETVMEQTLKPDKIILYLGLNAKQIDLPIELKNMQQRGLTIEYREDKQLKPHTKYFYAMQEYPNDIIITLDDDIFYNKNIIKNLYNSYTKYPKAVSAMRVHKITFDENKKIRNNLEWKWEYNEDDALVPNHYLDATGVGGVLYPPECMPKEVFNVETISKLSLNADDLWLKFSEIKNNIKVVKATKKNYRLYNIKGTQDIALNKTNVYQGENDKTITKLVEYYGITYKDFEK